MSRTAIDADRIGPTVALDEIELPDAVGQRMRTLYRSDVTPATAADCVRITREAIEASRDRPPALEDLCTTDDGAHAFAAANADAYQEYVCVLDPIAYPFLTDTPGTITSTTPVRDATVTVDVDVTGVKTSHDDAVISVGASDHVEAPDEVTPNVVYRQVCGYVRTFADECEYEEWTETVDATTTSVPLATGIGLAGALSTALFG